MVRPLGSGFAAVCVLVLAGFDVSPVSSSERIWTTAENQIVVQLAAGDTAAANPFDLEGRTLVFTPDGRGGYSRSVQPVAWEPNIGEAVADGAEVLLERFEFDFAGRRWRSFFVSRRGLITFGEPLRYSYESGGYRFETMRQINHQFATAPTISGLYKPLLGGFSDLYGATQRVAHLPDRVVVTWTTTEPVFYVHGVPPEKPARFQAVLAADGSIRLNYLDVHFGDGIVGLLPDEGVTKGALIAEIVDEEDPQLAGYVDLLEIALYESNTGAVILEFTVRDPIQAPPQGAEIVYRLFFDTDRPWWPDVSDPGFNWSDADFDWRIQVMPGGGRRASGRGVIGLTRTNAANRIGLLVDISEFAEIPAAVIADASQFDSGSFTRGDQSSTESIRLPTGLGPGVDLSVADGRFTTHQSEVFNYRGLPDLDEIACRVTEALGDEFDLLVFHNEFRVDSQESSTPWRPYFANIAVRGVGSPGTGDGPPCGARRLKGRWLSPVWVHSDHLFQASLGVREDSRFDRGLVLFAHEFAHSWTAYASYLRDGNREPLFGEECRCHWRYELHAPAAFPWHPDQAGPRSLMGGRWWRDNADGSFAPLDGYWAGGFSWLDLYAMGLADAGEVPDMFVLRNARPVRAGDILGPHTGERQDVSISQVVAALGVRQPPATQAQKDFNAGFVYLLEPGRRADGDAIGLHADYRDKVLEYWSHITGGRSRLSTTISNPIEGPDSDPDPDPDPDPPPPTDGPCRPSAESLCLHDDRYEVRVEWWTGDGETGSALVAAEVTQDSGLFRFFDADNWEILIKVLDGCEVNGHYWVYGASTTDLGYVIRVADTATGDVREYRNAPGSPAAAITDARAFPDSCRR